MESNQPGWLSCHWHVSISWCDSTMRLTRQCSDSARNLSCVRRPLPETGQCHCTLSHLTWTCCQFRGGKRPFWGHNVLLWWAILKREPASCILNNGAVKGLLAESFLREGFFSPGTSLWSSVLDVDWLQSDKRGSLSGESGAVPTVWSHCGGMYFTCGNVLRNTGFYPFITHSIHLQSDLYLGVQTLSPAGPFTWTYDCFFGLSMNI